MVDDTSMLLPHEEDVIFKKPSLKEFIRLIKNGSIQGIWPSTQKEYDWWNSTGVKEYESYGAKELPNINTALTVFYGDNQDNQSSENLNIEESEKNFNTLKNELNADIDNNLIKNFYERTIEDLNYPELVYDKNKGLITNAQDYIANNQTIINNFAKDIQSIEELQKLIGNYNPEIDTNKTVLSLTDEQFETDYNNLYILTDDGKIDSLLDNINYIYGEETIKTVGTSKEEINELLQKNQVINEDNIYSFVNLREKIIEEYYQKINETKNEDGTIKKDGAIKILKKYYPDEVTSISGKFNTTTFNTIYDNLISQIKDYEKKKENLEEQLKTFFSNFEIDNLYNLSNQCINSISIPLATSSSLSDKEKEELNSDDNKFYQKYLDPYYTLMEYISFFTTLGNYTNSNGENIDLVDYIEENYLKNVKQNIKDVSTLDEKIAIVNTEIVEFMQFELGQLEFSKTGTLINEIYSIVTTIDFLNDGYIKNQTEIIHNINLAIEIINKEKELADLYNLTCNFNIEQEDNLISYNSYGINIINDINDIINGNTNKEIQSLQTVYNNIFSQVTNYITYFNAIINNIKNLIINCDNQVSLIYTEANGVENKPAVKNSLEEYRTILIDHYQILIELGYNFKSNQKQIENDINTLLNRLDTIETKMSYGYKEDQYNAIMNFFTEEFFINKLYKITEDTIHYSDLIIPIPSENYKTIKNVSNVLQKIQLILDYANEKNREYWLEYYTHELEKKLLRFTPVYEILPFNHYTCFSSGSEVSFKSGTISNQNQIISTADQDGKIAIIVDNITYYPQVNGLTTSPTTARDTEIPTIKGLKNIFGESFNKLGTASIGSSYTPIYFNNGSAIEANNVVQGQYKAQDSIKGNYWNIVRQESNGSISTVSISATKMYGAVYNDYAEYRAADAEPGRCIIENGDGTLSLSTGRLQLGANIVSDTYGFAIGETNDATCPIAVCGRVLAHPLESKEVYHPGAAVCSGPEGTISLMTREEIREWPDAIVGYVSEVPTYDTWGSDNVPVNGRVWIKIK